MMEHFWDFFPLLPPKMLPVYKAIKWCKSLIYLMCLRPIWFYLKKHKFLLWILTDNLIYNTTLYSLEQLNQLSQKYLYISGLLPAWNSKLT